MMFFTDLHLALSKKLGWDEMPAKVAIPALDRIIEVSGVKSQSLWKYTDLELFVFLGCPFETIQDQTLFASLQWEIEREMFNGMSYEAAIGDLFDRETILKEELIWLVLHVYQKSKKLDVMTSLNLWTALIHSKLMVECSSDHPIIGWAVLHL